MKKLLAAGILVVTSLLWGITLHPPVNTTTHTLELSWNQYNGTQFSFYKLYRGLRCDPLRNDTLELIAEINDRLTTEYTDSLLHAGSKYLYRLFVIDTSGNPIDSSDCVSGWTGANSYPFVDSINVANLNFSEAPDCSWGLTTDQYHSAPYSFNDSPGHQFAPGSDNSLYLMVDLANSTMPVLSFWERHEMDNNRNGDHAYVQVSNDYGVSWTTIYSVQGQDEWTHVHIDLTQWKGAILLIRFRMEADFNSTVGHGWWIDDISVNESDAPAPSLPFFDDAENPDDYWLASSWKVTQTGINGSKAWDARPYRELGRDGDYDLTLGNQIDLSTHPQLQYYLVKSLYGALYAQVSLDSGYTWTTVDEHSINSSYTDYRRFQIDLSDYSNSRIRVRFRFHGYGDTWLRLDNIQIKEAPGDVVMEPPTEVTQNSAKLTWHRYSGADFKAYELRRATSSNVTWDSTLVARFTSPEDTIFVDSSLNAHTNYHYRVFVVDTTNMSSLGSNEISFSTQWITFFASYPYQEDFENGLTSSWVADSGWGITYGISHSGNASINESPDGNYPSGSDRSIYLGIDLASASMPVLSFYERTDFGDEYDQGHIEVSTNGYTWQRLYTVFQSHGWKKVSVDLSNFAHSPTVFIRFRFTSDDNDTTGNGWFIDDISIAETQTPEITYPFVDNVEDTSTTNYWARSSWDITSANGNNFYRFIAMDMTGYENSYHTLTLGNNIDLHNAIHPAVLFDIKGYANYTFLEVSIDSGRTYDTLWVGNSYANRFVHQRVDLFLYRGENVRIRFVVNRLWGGHHYPVYLDNIRIDEDYTVYNVVDSAKLVSPDTIIISTAMPTPTIYGMVYKRYVTDSTGQGTGIVAQVGYGPQGTQPSNSWTWSNASYVRDTSGFDLYSGILSPTQAGLFNFAFRFSIDSGNTWIYADLNGNDLGSGGTNGYSPGDAGFLNVTLVPHLVFYEDTIKFHVFAGDSISHYSEFSNIGDGSLYIHFTESLNGSDTSDVPWLHISPPREIIEPDNRSRVSLSVNADTLSAGATYTAYLAVFSNDPDANPLYIPIKVEVMDSTSNMLQGLLVTPQGNPINRSGTVQVYDGNTLINEVETDGIGQFSIPGISSSDTVSLRYFADGFYPGWKKQISGTHSRIYLTLSKVPSPIPTSNKVDFYGDTIRFNGNPLRKGDVITVYDPDGVLCGVGYVRNPGQYGFLHVYGDDPTTGTDEGARPGDTLLFLVNEYRAFNFRPDAPIWTTNNAIQKLNFDCGNADTLILRGGWNLISFTVAPENPEIDSILEAVINHTVIVTGFDQRWGGARTYDPQLPAYSDLQTMDPRHGYWIKLNSPDTLIVRGARLHSSTPLVLESGWNLISYLPEPAESVDVALSSIMGNIYVVDAFDSVAMTYRPGSSYNDLYIMKNGLGYWIKTYFEDTLYYECWNGSKNLEGSKGNSKSGIIPTPYWTDYYGPAALNGVPLSVGDTVAAYDPDGVLCGLFIVRIQGEYGFMHVYGDDPTTPRIDEGAVAGDSIRFFVNGEYVATASDSCVWTGARDLIEFPLGTTGVSERGKMPVKFMLSRIYPNPVRNTMRVRFAIPVKTRLKIAMYDISGKLVKVIKEGQFEAGQYVLNVSTKKLNSGIYFLRMESKKYSSTRRIIVVK